jgi:hypothetical protein
MGAYLKTCPSHFTSLRHDTHCTGGCVAPMAGLDGCGKSCPQLGFNPWTVQPIMITITTTLSWPTIPTVQIENKLQSWYLKSNWRKLWLYSSGMWQCVGTTLIKQHDLSPPDLHGVTSQMTVTLNGKAYGNICCSVQKLLSKIENISIYKIIYNTASFFFE